MDELAQSWNRLKLSDKEGLGCCLIDDDSKEKFPLLQSF